MVDRFRPAWLAWHAVGRGANYGSHIRRRRGRRRVSARRRYVRRRRHRNVEQRTGRPCLAAGRGPGREGRREGREEDVAKRAAAAPPARTPARPASDPRGRKTKTRLLNSLSHFHSFQPRKLYLWRSTLPLRPRWISIFMKRRHDPLRLPSVVVSSSSSSDWGQGRDSCHCPSSASSFPQLQKRKRPLLKR